jgi:plasmid maintenance system killer protein
MVDSCQPLLLSEEYPRHRDVSSHIKAAFGCRLDFADASESRSALRQM